MDVITNNFSLNSDLLRSLRRMYRQGRWLPRSGGLFYIKRDGQG